MAIAVRLFLNASTRGSFGITNLAISILWSNSDILLASFASAFAARAASSSRLTSHTSHTGSNTLPSTLLSGSGENHSSSSTHRERTHLLGEELLKVLPVWAHATNVLLVLAFHLDAESI